MPFNSDTTPPGARIKVIGVGGGGSNAVNTMIKSGLEGVEFLAANTDVQSLRFSLAPVKIQIGKELTRGLGAGADPDVGRDAALEDRHEIQEFLQGSDMVFITAGMGGGTGTGGASVVAQIARELGALTVAVVTKPFSFEGKRRKRHGEAGISRLRECVDTLITIPNQRLLTLASPDLAMVDAFKMADAVLVNAVKGISEIINTPGIVNVDFADVKAVMSCMGQALMGIGLASGEKRAIEAARQAIRSPLLEDVDIEGATGILINIAAGADVKMVEINEACMLVQEAAHEDANIIFGAVIDEALGDQIRVTVIATGFPIDNAEDDIPDSNKVHSASVSAQNSSRLTAYIQTPQPRAPIQAPITQPPYPHDPTKREDAPAKTVTQTPEVKATSESTLTSVGLQPPKEFESSTKNSDLINLDQVHESIDSPLETMFEVANAVLTPEPKFEALTSSTKASGESSHLARLTLDSAALENFCAGQVFPSLATANEIKTESRLEGARAIVDPKDEILTGVHQPEISRVGASIFDINGPKDPGLDETKTTVNSASDAAAPLEGLFESDPAMLASDIDRRIDEALELAERLNDPEIKREEDDLDVPAFIRNNLKDLSLS